MPAVHWSARVHLPHPWTGWQISLSASSPAGVYGSGFAIPLVRRPPSVPFSSRSTRRKQRRVLHGTTEPAQPVLYRIPDSGQVTTRGHTAGFFPLYAPARGGFDSICWSCARSNGENTPRCHDRYHRNDQKRVDMFTVLPAALAVDHNAASELADAPSFFAG